MTPPPEGERPTGPARHGSSLRDGGRGGTVLGTLFRHEIRMLLRDTRTILIAVVAPLILFPGYLMVTRWVERSEERRLDESTYTYAVVGPEAVWARELVRAALDPGRVGEEGGSRTTFLEEAPADPDAALAAGDLHLLVEAITASDYLGIRAREIAAAAGDDPGDVTLVFEGEPEVAVPALRIKYRARSDFSQAARERLILGLRAVRDEKRDSVYQAAGFPVGAATVATLETENVATAEKQGGAFLGLALTPFLVLLMLSGGSIVAADALSGEKERGTLETLLTTSARRREIVRAKQLAVLAVGLAVVVVNLLNLLVYLVLGVIELPAESAVSLAPMDLLVLLALFLPLALLVSGALLLLSGASRSYKEYQIYFFPVFLLFLVPTAAALLPGMELRSAIALVPVSGIAVAVREVMSGEADPLFAALAFLSTSALALWLTTRTERVLSNERLVAGVDFDEADLRGGPALFPRHVGRWFAGMWVLFFVVSLWLGDTLGLRGQIVVNLVGVFFGGSLLMVRRYRLDLREVFALRMPHPAAWPAVALGAPSALVLGVSLAQLVNTYLFPVPERLLEAFGESLAGPELPVWQLVLFLVLMPGVFEELAFRGALLHGLRRRLRPVALTLVVGLVFGLFHVSLFRIAPTAWLGTLLSASVLLTGSILPAMLWHALNNGLAVVPPTLGWWPAEMELPGWAPLLAAVGLAASLWILWATRRPYPGLRGARGRPD